MPELMLRFVCGALLLPPGGPLLLALAGVLLLRRSPRLGRALVALGLAVTLLLSLPVVADSLSAWLERYPPLDLSRPLDAGAIVVLAGGSRQNAAEGVPILRPVTLERLAGGARLARATGLPLLLSGGAPEAAVPEAVTMERELERAFGLKARWLETRSRTTRENARESAALLRALGIRRVLLVTSAVHMRRALAEFEAAGLEVVAAPVAGIGGLRRGLRAYLPQADALETSQAACHELAGLVVSRLRGGT